MQTTISPINFALRFTAAEMNGIYENLDAKSAFDRLMARDLIDLRGEAEHHDFMTVAHLGLPDYERIHEILEG